MKHIFALQSLSCSPSASHVLNGIYSAPQWHPINHSLSSNSWYSLHQPVYLLIRERFCLCFIILYFDFDCI